MAQTIKLKRSSTTGNVPTTSQLDLGELAINTTDGKMFIKKNVSGTESIVEINEVRPGAINFTMSGPADIPTNPAIGDMWKDSDNLKTFVYYENGGSPEWIEI
jgi:hypothetical protein